MHSMRIHCQSGLVVRLVDYPHDVLMGMDLYKSEAGYRFSGVEMGSTFSPGSIDMSSMVGLSPEITIASIQSGLFDKATVFLFATDWAAPVADHEPIFKGTFGKVTLQDNRYTTEIMNLIDLLNATIGDNYSAQCSLKFGGQEFGGCKVDAVALRVTGTITGVLNNYQFDDSARTEPEDYFGNGKAKFTTGRNAGTPWFAIASYTGVSGTVILTEPLSFLPEVGDEYTWEPGCWKRLEEDCRDKWNNTARRRGFAPPGEKFIRLIGGF